MDKVEISDLLLAQGVAQLFGFPALLGFDWRDLAQLGVEPFFADLKRREGLIPASLELLSTSAHVLDDEAGNGKQPGEPRRDAEFPLPARFGRGRQPAARAIAPVGAAGSLPVSPGTAQIVPRPDCFLDPGDRVSLKIEVRVCFRLDREGFFLGAGIDAHGYGLNHAIGASGQADIEQSTIEAALGFSCANQLSGSRRMTRH